MHFISSLSNKNIWKSPSIWKGLSRFLFRLLTKMQTLIGILILNIYKNHFMQIDLKLDWKTEFDYNGDDDARPNQFWLGVILVLQRL